MKFFPGLLVVGFLFFSTCLVAQQTTNIHIATSPDNYMQHFPFQFTVNGQPYKLKAGQCLELSLQTDSVHIVMEDKRWVKNETVDLHTAAVPDLYVRVFFGWKPNDKKRIRFFAEAICQSCFEEYKKKCKKEFRK